MRHSSWANDHFMLKTSSDRIKYIHKHSLVPITQLMTLLYHWLYWLKTISEGKIFEHNKKWPFKPATLMLHSRTITNIWKDLRTSRKCDLFLCNEAVLVKKVERSQSDCWIFCSKHELWTLWCFRRKTASVILSD